MFRKLSSHNSDVSRKLKPGMIISIIPTNENINTIESSRIYNSQVLKVAVDGSIQAFLPQAYNNDSQPIEIGICYQFFFSNEGTRYKAIGKVTKRYRDDAMFLMSIKLETNLENAQRRQHCRYNQELSIKFADLNWIPTDEHEIAEYYRIGWLNELNLTEFDGTTIDISAGGLAFSARMNIPVSYNIGSLLRLCITIGKKPTVFIGKIVRYEKSRLTSDNEFNLKVAVQFMFLSEKTQDNLINELFKLEREKHRRQLIS